MDTPPQSNHKDAARGMMGRTSPPVGAVVVDVFSDELSESALQLSSTMGMARSRHLTEQEAGRTDKAASILRDLLKQNDAE